MTTFIYECGSLFCPTKDITLLTAQPTDPQNLLCFQAGQYVEALLRNGQRLALSIANAPQRNGELVFHLRHNANHPVAEYWLNEVKRSGKLILQGPFGHNTLTRLRPDFNVLFLAGGTGFAPIRSLLMALSEQKTNLNLKLFWGITRPEDAYDLPFLDHAKNTIANFEAHLILSDPIYTRTTSILGKAANKRSPRNAHAVHDGGEGVPPTQRKINVESVYFSKWNGPVGWAHDYCLQLTKAWEKTLVYASGPFEMIQAAFQSFTQKGLPASRFLSDMPMPVN